MHTQTTQKQKQYFMTRESTANMSKYKVDFSVHFSINNFGVYAVGYINNCGESTHNNAMFMQKFFSF